MYHHVCIWTNKKVYHSETRVIVHDRKDDLLMAELKLASSFKYRARAQN